MSASNPYGFNPPHAPGSQLWCEALSKFISLKVDDDSVKEYHDPEQRWHLGASVVGKDCARAIWYSFRWATVQQHSGRMYRLFQRGHREEDQFVHRLRRIGMDVWDRDPNSWDHVKSEQKQWRISNPENAFFGGSLDAIVRVPYVHEFYQFMIGEFKTHKDSSFQSLVKKGVKGAKPEHYGQMCAYGMAKGYSLGLYCAVNKDDDDLWWQVVTLDSKHGAMLTLKALSIIQSQTPPNKVSQNSADWRCKSCEHRPVCHQSGMMAINCRSCVNAFARPDGEFYCSLYGGPIPRATVQIGCGNWRQIA